MTGGYLGPGWPGGGEVEEEEGVDEGMGVPKRWGGE